jgi:EmrB/QacA subfamily drug resistance transporter
LKTEPRWSLIVAILGSAMAFIDSTVVNVALPVMQRVLHATVSQMQWVVEAYMLLLSALVLVGGALGDRFGRKRIFVSGVIFFAVASAACGAAPDATLLIVARAVQGVGAALLIPGSLALISAAYPENERGKAIGTWSAASAITTAVGPLIGGFLVSHASWRWLFYLNVPIAVVVVVLALGRVEETRNETASKAVDGLGAALAVTGLGIIVFALLDAPRLGGVTGSTVLGLLAAGVAILGVFVFAEARQREPMVPLGLFRSPMFAATNLLTLLLYAALGGGLFFVPFNLIQVQKYSATEAGASFVPFVVLISVMSVVMSQLVKRVGPRLPLVVGPLVAAAGFALLAVPGVGGGSYWTTFFPGTVTLGLGMGITVAPLTTSVMGSVDTRHAGVASGINNSISRVATVLAVAALGVVLSTRFRNVLGEHLEPMGLSAGVRATIDAQRAQLAAADLEAVPPELHSALRAALEDAYVAGFRALMLTCAGLATLGALVFGLTFRPKR